MNKRKNKQENFRPTKSDFRVVGESEYIYKQSQEIKIGEDGFICTSNTWDVSSCLMQEHLLVYNLSLRPNRALRSDGVKKDSVFRDEDRDLCELAPSLEGARGVHSGGHHATIDIFILSFHPLSLHFCRSNFCAAFGWKVEPVPLLSPFWEKFSGSEWAPS